MLFYSCSLHYVYYRDCPNEVWCFTSMQNVSLTKSLYESILQEFKPTTFRLLRALEPLKYRQPWMFLGVHFTNCLQNVTTTDIWVGHWLRFYLNPRMFFCFGEDMTDVVRLVWILCKITIGSKSVHSEKKRKKPSFIYMNKNSHIQPIKQRKWKLITKTNGCRFLLFVFGSDRSCKYNLTIQWTDF